MTLHKLIAASLLLSSSFSALAEFELIHNVKGYTLTRQGDLKTFSTLVFKDGKVVRTGDEGLLKSYSQAKKIDGKQHVLLPGLIDAHGHVIGLGQNLVQLELRNTRSKAEIGEQLSRFAQDKSGWIIGRGWNQENWPTKQFPTAADLDKYVSDRPVILSRVDGHAVWVNSKAMALAGINSNTKAPAGGEILRLANGEPSGIFIDKAEELIRVHQPKPSKEQLNAALDAAGKHLLALGITSVHDAGIDYPTWQIYKERDAAHTMPMRIFAMLSAADPKLETMLQAGVYKDQQDFLSIRSVKIYADGALGSRGAALIDDYADRSGHKGLMLESQEKLEQLFELSFKYGFSANTHAIGDMANHTVLDAYENTFKKTGGKLLRNRIEHAQIVTPADIPRFKSLGIIPSMQPVHATSDMHMAEQRLNAMQLQGAYAWQSFLNQGSKVAAGSDFPVELANIFDGLYAAITRMDHNQQPELGWRNNEALSRKDAFKAFSLDAAYAAHQEFKLGSLEQGKWADFILIDQDIFTIDAADIYKTQVLETWLAGEQKYKR
ncbi:amidohydrolase [Pseudoalteromonas tunicata]|uniref:amidohydrolase n=1 Tax=Pseudoalteromonas tunicata TaxID=314281 RepID=UPI00273F68C1|nr:amidohydrolase [Pseudoalteromonas tunicata]MDP5214025.1 amidohydrolase [Pseudoalteromonas tunicata]